MVELLKERYNQKYIELLADKLELYHAILNKEAFIDSIFDKNWREKELKERMRHISHNLYKFLPLDYDKAINILKKVFLEMNYDFGLENIIFQDFVEVYGLEHFDKSMEALECFTKNSSSEFAIRQFILKYPKQTMKQMKKWAKSKDLHVRRLASEGCRPKLPWAIALKNFQKDPSEVIEILEILKDDESKYIQKSIANNLNDISKDNPDILINIAKKWMGTKNRDWIIKHGSRTLLKAGNKEILSIFGFTKPKNIKLNNFLVDEKVKMGEKLNFSFKLSSKEALGKLRIEYAVYFLRQKDKYSKKVFKISEGAFEEKSKEIKKAHSFKIINTRKYYKGLHKISIILNGVELKEREFSLS